MRRQLNDAAALLGVTVAPVTTASSTALGNTDVTGVIVHDFAPDPLSAVSWLQETTRTQRGLTVFGLLDSPATATLHALARARAQLPMSGMAIAAEESVQELAHRLQDAMTYTPRAALASVVTERLTLDPVLKRIAEHALTQTVRYTTLGHLLREIGLTRKIFVRHAQRAGFDPPLRFFHALRVLEGCALITQGYSASSTAAKLGYASCGTMRRHFRELLGVPPSRIRETTLNTLVQQVSQTLQISTRS